MGLPSIAEESTSLAVRTPQAAKRGALRTVLATGLLTFHMPFWLQGAFDSLCHSILRSGYSYGATLALGNGVLLSGGIALIWLIARAVAPAVRTAAARSPEEGRASAAGAGMAAAGIVTALVVGVHTMTMIYFGEALLWLLVLRVVAALGAVGLFGSFLFPAANQGETKTPPLYAGLRVAGFNTVAGLFVLGFLGFSPASWLSVAALTVGALGGAFFAAKKASASTQSDPLLGTGSSRLFPQP